MNIKVVHNLNLRDYYPPKTLELYLESNEFKKIDEKAVIVFDEYRHVNTKEYIYKYSKKNHKIAFSKDFINEFYGHSIPKSYFIKYHAEGKKYGFIEISEIIGIDINQLKLILLVIQL